MRLIFSFLLLTFLSNNLFAQGNISVNEESEIASLMDKFEAMKKP